MHTEDALRAKSYKELQKIARAHPGLCRTNAKQAEMLEALVAHFCGGLQDSGPTIPTPVCVAKDTEIDAATRSSDEAARDETPRGTKRYTCNMYCFSACGYWCTRG